MAAQLLQGQLFQTCPVPSTDLTGRTYVITGGNSGLGLDAAKHMYRLNCGHLVLACRDLSKGEAAKEDIMQTIKPIATTKLQSSQPTPTISVWHLDMASYKSVAAFAQRVSTNLPQINGVILNAGINVTEHSTAEGLESTITVNVTSTFLLAILLIPILKNQSNTSTTGTKAPTITIVGSAVQHFAKTDELTKALDAGDSKILKSISKSDDKPVMENRYFLSKLLVMILTVQLTKHMTSSPKGAKSTSGVTVNCIGPGWCKTPLFRHDDTAAVRIGLRLIGRSSEEGSKTLVHGVVDAGTETHGCYVSEGRIKRMSKFVDSTSGRKIGELLWNEMVGIAEDVERGCIEKI